MMEWTQVRGWVMPRGRHNGQGLREVLPVMLTLGQCPEWHEGVSPLAGAIPDRVRKTAKGHMLKPEKQGRGTNWVPCQFLLPAPTAVQQLRVASGFSQNDQAATPLPLNICGLLLTSGFPPSGFRSLSAKMEGTQFHLSHWVGVLQNFSQYKQVCQAFCASWQSDLSGPAVAVMARTQVPPFWLHLPTPWSL